MKYDNWRELAAECQESGMSVSTIGVRHQTQQLSGKTSDCKGWRGWSCEKCQTLNATNATDVTLFNHGRFA